MNDVLLLKMMGSETKYKILNVLRKGEKCACEIPELIGTTQSNTSMQLQELARNHVIEARRDGKKMIYKIKEPRILKIFKAIKVET